MGGPGCRLLRSLSAGAGPPGRGLTLVSFRLDPQGDCNDCERGAGQCVRGVVRGKRRQGQGGERRVGRSPPPTLGCSGGAPEHSEGALRAAA